MTLGQPGRNDVPYHIKHTTAASVTDGEADTIVIHDGGQVERVYPNDPEGLDVVQYERETGHDVEYVFNLGSGFWDVESQDMCRLVAIERRVREDKSGEKTSEQDTPWAVLKYMKDTEGVGFGTVEQPSYDLDDEYGSGKLSHVLVDDFDALTISGSRHSLKQHANHESKSLDDFRWLTQRRFSDRSNLPP